MDAAESSNPELLVGLQAQPPLRVPHAVIDGSTGVLRRQRTIHRLKEIVAKLQMLQVGGHRPGLRKNELELIA